MFKWLLLSFTFTSSLIFSCEKCVEHIENELSEMYEARLQTKIWEGQWEYVQGYLDGMHRAGTIYMFNHYNLYCSDGYSDLDNMDL